MNNLSLIPAATVLLIRDSDEGLQVLMVKRSKRPPFENLYVFPGGKIDQSDKDQKLVNFSSTLDDKLASNKLGIDEGGLSYWVACIRECFEEVGVLLAKRNNGEYSQLIILTTSSLWDNLLKFFILSNRVICLNSILFKSTK